MFEIGDKVRIIDEKGEGLVVKIINSTLFEIEIDGFTYKKSKQELVLSEPLPIKEQILNKDFKNKQESDPISFSKDGVKLFFDKKLRGYFMEMDLHYGELEDYRPIKANERLSFQLDFFVLNFNLALARKCKKVVIIHGVGEGILKEEIRHILKGYEKIEFYDASYQKYGKGATEVKIY